MRSVGGLGLSFLFRRARSSWLLLACVAVTVLLATGLAAVLWTFAGAVIPLGAQDILAGSQSRVIGLSGEVDGGQAAADSQQIRATLRKAWPGVGFQMESALWAAPLQLSSSAESTANRQIQPASVEGISAQATLTAGTWPGPPQHGGPVPVALPAAAASQLHLTVGSVLIGTPQSGGAPTSLQVTGLYRPRNPASPYWALDLLPISGISVQHYNLAYPGPSTPPRAQRPIERSRVHHGGAVSDGGTGRGAEPRGGAGPGVIEVVVLDADPRDGQQVQRPVRRRRVLRPVQPGDLERGRRPAGLEGAGQHRADGQVQLAGHRGRHCHRHRTAVRRRTWPRAGGQRRLGADPFHRGGLDLRDGRSCVSEGHRAGRACGHR